MPCGIGFLYEMEDWMKRSYCLLQELRYPSDVNKDLHKMLKKIKTKINYVNLSQVLKKVSQNFTALRLQYAAHQRRGVGEVLHEQV